MPDDAPPPAPEYHEAPYLMQMPDGSTQSRVLRTDRPITHGELSDYVASQGGVYMGPPPPPAPPAEQPPPPAEAPPPAPELVGPPEYLPPEVRRMLSPGTEAEWTAERQRTSPMPPAPGPPPVPPPSPQPPPDYVRAATGYDLGGGAPLAGVFAPPPPPAPPPPAPAPEPAPTAREVYAPKRSLQSQVPSIMGATVFGTTATGLAAPLGPEVAIPVGMGAAGLGSAVGEGTQIISEKVSGSPPAEPGGVVRRLGNAFTRGATFEAPAQALRYVPALIASKAAPTLEAAERMRPILTGTAETAPTAGKAAEVLKPGAQLPAWWQTWSARPPQKMLAAWEKLGEEGQRELAGPHFDDMQTIMDTIAEGAEKWSAATPVIGATTGGAAHYLGHPYAAASLAFGPTGRAMVTQGTPFVLSGALRTPGLVPPLLWLPKAGRLVAEPLMLGARTTSQTVGAENWPEAETTFPPR